jgi:hypothetical protein
MEISMAHELTHLKLPDARLNRRARLIAERMQQQLSESLPGLCPDWSELIGAYRFFDNDRVDAGDLLQPHRERTLERARQCAVVRCVEDTTIFDFGKHPSTSGLGPISADYQNGFLCHSMMAYDGSERCLGMLRQQCWARSDGLGKRKERKRKSIEEKETFRWLEGLRYVEELARQDPGRLWLYIADREADIYELFYEREHADFVIRVQTDRRTTQDSGGEKMLTKVGATGELGRWQIEVPPRLKRATKKITVSVKACEMALDAPWRPSRVQRKRLFTHPVKATLVLVEEIDPPEGEKPVCWILLTSLAVADFAQAREVVEHYRCRWQIEIFFRTLKSGCGYESLQLRSFARLKRALAIYSLVAWRIVALCQQAKSDPQASSAQVLCAEELQAIFLLRRKQAPQAEVKLGEALTELAKLGGYLNRKGDAPPGPTAIWRGLRQIGPVALLLKLGVIRSV